VTRQAFRAALIAVVGLLASLGPRPSVAAAHPLDEYLQATYVTLAPDGLTVELD
jgi:hypothetical protein